MSFTITPASSPADLNAIRDLFRTYTANILADKIYPGQNLEHELATLPGVYTSLLIARDAKSHAPLGCIAIRSLDTRGCCELKRLYVHPHARGRGLGKALVEAIIKAAKEAGYKEIKLDTLKTLYEARRLYQRAGFVETEPYYDIPFKEECIFMSRSL